MIMYKWGNIVRIQKVYKSMGSAKSRNGMERNQLGCAPCRKIVTDGFCIVSNCHTVTRIVLEFISFYLYAC